MTKKVLLLGSSGKMGQALERAFAPSYQVLCKNSQDFNALDFKQVQELIESARPELLINTVAFLGIDPCEQEPEKAFTLNCLYPKLLASLSVSQGFKLIHFSTDAVFNDAKRDYYVESDKAAPVNLYGATKYSGDCIVQSLATDYYIFRLSVLFGLSSKPRQFVEKMLEKIKAGQTELRIASDIIGSPSYSLDLAAAVYQAVERELPPGLYHLANQGQASLFDLMQAVVKHLGLGVSVLPGSYKDFSALGVKNTFTPIRSEKLPPLRPWQAAVQDYCVELKL